MGSFQNNVVININEVSGIKVTYLGYLGDCILGPHPQWCPTLYFRSEEQFAHPFERHAEEVLNSSWSFWVELPHPERSTFARQGPSN